MSHYTIPVQQPGFHLAQVVDARADRSMLGWVLRGMVSSRADFQKGFVPELTDFLAKPLPPRAGSHPLVVRISRLVIAEQVGATVTATATLAVDFLTTAKDDQYYVVAHATETAKRGGLMNAADRHVYNIAQVLEQALQKLANAPAVEQPEQFFSLAEIQNSGQRHLDFAPYPVQTTATLQKGVYNSFAEFCDNAPGNVRPVEIERRSRSRREWTGTEEVGPYFTVGEKRYPIGDVWGFSDGQQAYIHYRHNYFPLTRTNAGVTFDGFAPADPEAVANGIVLGGLIGSAIGAATSSGHRTQYELDMLTGLVLEAGYPGGPDAPDTARVVVFRQPEAKPVVPAISVLVGGAHYTLRSGDYIVVPWTNKQADVSICGEGATSECLKFQPNFMATNYVECTVDASTQVSGFHESPAKEGQFYVRRIQVRRQASR